MRVESTRPNDGMLGGWLHRAAERFAVSAVSLPPKVKPQIDWGVMAASMYLAGRAERLRLAAALGVPSATLGELRIGSGWDDYRREPYSSWPERDATGKVVGIVRRYADGRKKTMRHSSHGLYFAHPMIRMAAGPVFLVEGGSDTAALLGIGCNVVGRPSNLGGVKQLAMLLASVRNTVLVLGERDNKPQDRCPPDCRGCLLCWPGLAGAKETAKRLAALLGRNVYWVLPPAKDVREWLSANRVTGTGFLAAVAAWRAENVHA